MTTLSIFGIYNASYSNFFIRAGATSVYTLLSFGTIYCNLLFLKVFFAAVLAW